jgi:thymidylate kinase
MKEPKPPQKIMTSNTNLSKLSTLLLDIAPEVSARRKTRDRDRFERDLALLGRVRRSYEAQVTDRWSRIDADRDRILVAADIYAAVAPHL